MISRIRLKCVLAGMAALALFSTIGAAFAQSAPPPVPALPDTDRVQSYSISSSNCACAVNFALFGDSNDYQNWLTVYVNKVAVAYNDATFGWTVTSPTGALASIPRPVTDAVLTFNSAQTGTIDIVGARRPRRVAQFAENRGVAARDLNQALTDIVAQNRETWDLWERAITFEPGFTPNALPIAAARAGQFLCFAAGTGQPTTCAASTGSTTFAAGAGITLSGVSPTTIINNIQAGNGVGLTGTNPIIISRGVGGLNAQSGNWTGATSDCGKVVVATGGLNTLTLPAASSVTTGCEIGIKNGETYPGGRGKKLVNFPSDFVSAASTILWPTQAGTVKSNGTIWLTTQSAGRWINQAQVTLHVDKTNGSNTNDGLATGLNNALADPQTAWATANYQFDIQGHTPILALACGQTHTVQLGMGGTPGIGSNLVQLSPDGNCGANWSNSGPCINVSDLAELDLNLNFYGSSGGINFNCNNNNATFSGNIYLHNAVVLDLEGAANWTPGGNSDNFLFCDGPCEFTVANGFTQLNNGAANYVINMSEGGKGTQSGTISNGGTGLGSLQGIYFLFGGAFLNISTASGAGWTSVGTSKVYGHATIVTNGVTPVGGYSIGASGVACTTLTTNC